MLLWFLVPSVTYELHESPSHFSMCEFHDPFLLGTAPMLKSEGTPGFAGHGISETPSLFLAQLAQLARHQPASVVRRQVLRLKSGDLLLMGGESRQLWHGISRVIPNTTPSPHGATNFEFQRGVVGNNYLECSDP